MVIKKDSIYFFFICIFIISHTSLHAHENTVPEKQWTVVGAGPAGIIVISMLLELGINAHDIAWIDPDFSVGRLGKYYKTVPGNSETRDFIEFLNGCSIFHYCDEASVAAINSYGCEDEYPLSIIIEPLQTITNYICTHVTAHRSTMTALEFIENEWHVGTAENSFTSHNVILATGACPKALSYEGPQPISLDSALDKATLATLVCPDDTIAVVGGSHSAILLLKYLSELPVKQVINFYKKPLCYSYEKDGIYYNATDGLKGTAARWAKNVLEKNPPANVKRVLNTPEGQALWLPHCTKIIYAIGYERSALPSISTLPHCYDSYDAHTGIIGPRLFGIGIAFPEQYTDLAGSQQLGIGLIDFMQYAQYIVPSWLDYSSAHVQRRNNRTIFALIPW